MPDGLEGTVLSGFQLIELIGEGAHGSVWRARQTRLDRDVAVKILDPVVARNPETVRRFEREGRAAASLDHPNVVPVYEAGESEGLVFLAMRLVEGTTLEDHLAAHGACTAAEAAQLLAPIADALDHAHERNLVHRDVKPSNILMDGDNIWLADFGIAASLRELGNYTTGALGTAEFMAPEQASAGDVDHRADLYGLGCVVHFLLEGAPPYDRDDLVATLMAHVNDPVPQTGDVTNDAFYARALAKDPDDRFQSASELVTALAGDSAPVTPPATASTTSGSAAPRWIKPLAGVLAVVVALVIGLLLITSGGDGGDDTADASDATDPAESADPTDPESADGAAETADGADGAEGPDGADGDGVISDDGGGTTDGGDAVVPLVGGGNVEVGTVRSLMSLNPHVDRFVEPFISGHVLPPLMNVEDDWTLTPWLAAAPPEVTSVDPLVVRWTLRSDAVWSDGSSITSRDVGRTLDYMLDPESGAAGLTLYEGVTLAEVDDHTFDLTFPFPQGAHRVMFSTFHPIIQAAAYDAHLAAGNPSSSFLVEGIGFSGGPFEVAGYDPGQRLTLVPNDQWWGEPALLGRVTIRSFDSAAAQLAAIETGDVDLIYVETAGASDASRAGRVEGVTVDVGIGGHWLRMDMNTRKGQMSELAVRTAVATALDRGLLNDSAIVPIVGEAVPPLQSLVWQSSHPDNADPFEVHGGNVAEAQAILQAAGWELGQAGARFKDGEVLEVELLFDPLNGLLGTAVAQSVVLQLRDAGIRVAASALGQDDAFARRRQGDYDLFLAIDVGGPDPVAAGFRWGSEYCPAEFEIAGCESLSPINLTGIDDPQLDSLLAAAAAEPDAAARHDLFVAVDARLAELVPALPLFELPTFVAHIDELGGVAIDTHRGGPFVGMARWGHLPGS